MTINIPIGPGIVGVSVTTLVGVGTAVVKIAVGATEEGIATVVIVTSGMIGVSVSVTISVGIKISEVVPGRSVVGDTVKVGEMATSLSVSLVQVHLLEIFWDMSFDKLSSASSVYEDNIVYNDLVGMCFNIIYVAIKTFDRCMLAIYMRHCV